MQKFWQFVFKCLGWKLKGQLPELNKYIVIVAPHTSNWDLIICLIARFAAGTKINFIAKHQVFVPPLSWLLKSFGGNPIDRSVHHNMVEQVVDLYKKNEIFRFGLAPEGTRSPVKRWKAGFYHIACQAKIPIIMIGPDYPSKEIRISEPFWPSGHIEEDFPKILAFFRQIQGYHPKEIPDYQASRDK